LNDAAQYYHLEDPGLGAAFLEEVNRCLESIQAYPEAGVILRGGVRRRLLCRFPYALLYKVKPSGVRILVVMNLKRRPGTQVVDGGPERVEEVDFLAADDARRGRPVGRRSAASGSAWPRVSTFVTRRIDALRRRDCW
jgi:hypothetical protein